MRRGKGGYLAATRHPWPCLVFLIPLLGAYEGGILWLAGGQPETVRNGADTWLRRGLEAFGLNQLYWGPAFIALVFLVWSVLRRYDRPTDTLSVCSGMAFESLLFALGLWGISRGFDPFLRTVGLAVAPSRDPARTLAPYINAVGAGIYEEMLFRLLLFSGLLWLLLQFRVGALLAFLLSAVGSATLFSAAHHAGPQGEPFDRAVFLFRTCAGLYFTILFQLRGFGIAVGAHACYDVLAGLIVE